MSCPSPTTYFASPERMTEEEVRRLHDLLTGDDDFCTLVDAMPEFVMVVGPTRQILYGNRAVAEFAASQKCQSFIGDRPGEFLSCRHALTAPAGCGTGEACRTCGAVEAILAGLAGNRACHECRVLRDTDQGPEALDLRVWGTPFRWRGESLALVIAVDISNEKRRKVLERLFFHDILNTAGAISGLAELLVDGILTVDEAKKDLMGCVRALVEEIRGQRELLAAENGELTVVKVPLHSRTFLESVIYTYRNTPLGREREINIAPGSFETLFRSDERLLGRVLGNLVKNALEASPAGGRVTVGCSVQGDEISFWCNNSSAMAPRHRCRYSTAPSQPRIRDGDRHL